MGKKFADFNELVMMGHSIFSFPFIFIAMVVAADGWFGYKLLILGTIAAFTARNFAMAFNRYVDRDVDRNNQRTANRPSVDGRISANAILFFVFANALVFIATTYFVNHLALTLSFPILVVLASYSYFKRFSSFAHIILGITLAFAPMAGAIAVLETVPVWSLVLATGVMFWVAGFDILYSLQDIDFDKKLGLFSIPSRFGAQNSLRIALVFHLGTIFFWGWFIYLANYDVFGILAVIFATIMLGYEHYLVRKDFTKINRAFFTVNGYLGIVFFLLIVASKVFS